MVNDVILTSFDQEYLDIFGDEQTFNKFCINVEVSTVKITNECTHESFFEEDGIRVCKQCGLQTEFLTFEPEWKFYDGKSDPSRCHRQRSIDSRGSIDKTFQKFKIDLPESYKKQTEVKYYKVVGDSTLRGKGRDAIIAAALLYVFWENGDPRTSDEVRSLFDLTKNKMSDGITRYLEKFPLDRTRHIEPIDLIRRIMHRTKVDMKHLPKIIAIAKSLENTSYLLNHSSPQSVASAIVYLYLCINPTYKEALGLTKSKFSSKSGLSDITISKLVKEAARIVGFIINP